MTCTFVMVVLLYYTVYAPGGGGGLLWYFHVYVGSGHFLFLGFKILNFIFWGVFRKINIFGGTKILWISFGGHHKIGLYLGAISIHFRVFSFLGQRTD